MLKCKCGNDMVDNFKWNDINEYICRDCNTTVMGGSDAELYNDTTNMVYLECGCTLLEIED